MEKKQYKYTPEGLERIRKALKGNKNRVGSKNPKAQVHRRKKVAQLTLDGEIINIFESMSEAERITGVPQSDISLVCSGKQYRKTAHGYKWRLIVEE